MMNLIGIPIGFYGYLFPGNINIMMVDLFRSKNFKLLWFSLALTIVFESIYCIATLQFLETIKTNELLFKGIELLSLFMTLAMGIWMLFEKKNKEKQIHKNNIRRGILSIIIHPQQIPFWLLVAVIINPLALNHSFLNLALFALANAFGALLAMLLYITVGNKIINFFSIKAHTINKAVACVYIVMSFTIVLKLIQQ